MDLKIIAIYYICDEVISALHIRALLKPHLSAKIAFFGIFEVVLFSHVPSHCLQRTTPNLLKKIQFFQTKRVLEELYSRGSSV